MDTVTLKSTDLEYSRQVALNDVKFVIRREGQAREKERPAQNRYEAPGEWYHGLTEDEADTATAIADRYDGGNVPMPFGDGRVANAARLLIRLRSHNPG